MRKETILRILFFTVVLLLILFFIKWFLSNTDPGYLPRLFKRITNQ